MRPLRPLAAFVALAALAHAAPAQTTEPIRFARNAGACAFYERNAFVAVAHGFEPTWQLADVRYEWTARGGLA